MLISIAGEPNSKQCAWHNFDGNSSSSNRVLRGRTPTERIRSTAHTLTHTHRQSILPGIHKYKTGDYGSLDGTRRRRRCVTNFRSFSFRISFPFPTWAAHESLELGVWCLLEIYVPVCVCVWASVCVCIGGASGDRVADKCAVYLL